MKCWRAVNRSSLFQLRQPRLPASETLARRGAGRVLVPSCLHAMPVMDAAAAKWGKQVPKKKGNEAQCWRNGAADCVRVHQALCQPLLTVRHARRSCRIDHGRVCREFVRCRYVTWCWRALLRVSPVVVSTESPVVRTVNELVDCVRQPVRPAAPLVVRSMFRAGGRYGAVCAGYVACAWCDGGRS